jgi:tryptophanyl-tRNA synthetase
MSFNAKPVLFSGIQPTGRLMIGNYTGALKNWVRLQGSHEALFMVADLHALTAVQDPLALQNRSFELAALFLACGVDPERSTIFQQSRVPAHTQLMWVLNCVVPMGDLQRMTQFKDKTVRQARSINSGLFSYPVLMAADILLYGADRVPVGEDQTQHLEFTRRVARAFNAIYGDVFKIPEGVVSPCGARLMALQEPTVKMSKSDQKQNNTIALLDPPEVVRRKIQLAVTDSGSEVRCEPAKPGLCNLMTLMEAVTGADRDSISARYTGRGYAEFKKDLAEAVVEFLNPVQKRYAALVSNPPGLEAVLQRGAESAFRRSQAMLQRVFDVVGLRSYKAGGIPATGGSKSLRQGGFRPVQAGACGG